VGIEYTNDVVAAFNAAKTPKIVRWRTARYRIFLADKVGYKRIDYKDGSWVATKTKVALMDNPETDRLLLLA
jgi:frataxin-like iron-binding protein CyaY